MIIARYKVEIRMRDRTASDSKVASSESVVSACRLLHPGTPTDRSSTDI